MSHLLSAINKNFGTHLLLLTKGSAPPSRKVTAAYVPPCPSPSLACRLRDRCGSDLVHCTENRGCFWQVEGSKLKSPLRTAFVIYRHGILGVRCREILLISSSTLPGLGRGSAKNVNKLTDFNAAVSSPGLVI